MPQRHLARQHRFVDARPVALIDFDMAKPGPRMRDVSYGAFLWLNLGWDGRSPTEQRRRLRLWCDAYGLAPPDRVIEEIKQRVTETVCRRAGDGAHDAASWWRDQLGWLEQHERRVTIVSPAGESQRCQLFSQPMSRRTSAATSAGERQSLSTT